MTPLAPLASPVLTDGPFDLIAGIPVHPLVVHAVVVLLPLSALALVAIVLVPKWRGAFGWVTIAGLAIGTASAFVARASGEQLAARVGLPQDHFDLGSRLPLAAASLFVVAAVWFVLQRRAAFRAARQEAGPQGTVLVRILGIVAIVMALATTALTVATGHTGAVSVWEDRVQPASAGVTPTPAATPMPTADGSPSPGDQAVGGLTLADVQQHATADDCWSVVDGTVYDLTSWISQHPGGPEVIQALCGTDASAAFAAQHEGQDKPAKQLAGFEVGVLVATPAAAGPAITIASAAFTAQHGSASNVAAILKSFRIGRLA